MRISRESLRLPEFDYSWPGAYFVTICSPNMRCVFGYIKDGVMYQNGVGKMVETNWQSLEQRYPTIVLDDFIVMPNHFHGILWIKDVGAGLVSAHTKLNKNTGMYAPFVHDRETKRDLDLQRRRRAETSPAPTFDSEELRLDLTLSDVICTFKSLCTNQYLKNIQTKGWPRYLWKLWQRNYYDHIIRDGKDMQRIQAYIRDNPLNWDKDRFNQKSSS